MADVGPARIGNRRAVVVTGAGRGLGLAIAERLSEEGWFVVGVERVPEHTKRFRELISDRGAMVEGDVRELDVLENAARVAEEEGTLTGWVNNAAVVVLGNLHEPRRDEVDAVFAINLLAPFWGCSVALSSFLANDVAGRIVNVSSIHATHAFPSHAAYDTTKGGINSLTRYIAVEYGPVGIRANAIAPGAIETEPLIEAIQQSDDPAKTARELAVLHPMERLGKPPEAAAAAAFLLSDDASFISGQIVGVDGGAAARAFRFETELPLGTAASRERQPHRGRQDCD